MVRIVNKKDLLYRVRNIRKVCACFLMMLEVFEDMSYLMACVIHEDYTPWYNMMDLKKNIRDVYDWFIRKEDVEEVLREAGRCRDKEIKRELDIIEELQEKIWNKIEVI